MNRTYKRIVPWMGVLTAALTFTGIPHAVSFADEQKSIPEWGPQGRHFGIGILIGEPTGISWKNWTSGTNALNGGLAWSLGRNGSALIHVDYLWHDFHFIEVETNRLPFFYGIGGRVLFAGSGEVGLRVPVGISYLLDTAPVELSFELVPVVNVIPRTELVLNGGLGVRFYF